MGKKPKSAAEAALVTAGQGPRPPDELTGAKLKADKTTIDIEATKDGKLRCRASAWDETLVVLPYRQLVIRNVGNQVHVYDVPQE